MSTARRNGEGERWAAHLRSIVEENGGALATVEVMCDQPEPQPNGKRRRPLHGVRYDGKTDVLEFAVGGHRERPVRYFIAAPRTFDVTESHGRRVVIVGDASGTRTLISLFAAGAAAATARPAPSRVIAIPSHYGLSRRF
ncbi:MAG TPA: hypothetical protein VGO14_08355 [Solirubrobacteraceae bacterium]|jgi:hypothetical protein|nr:hypothetical protein [Solirubrobacteraceae bacterium]